MPNRRLLALLRLALVLSLAGALPAQAEDANEIKRIQSLLSVINAEIKSDLEQVQMLQEALKLNARIGFGPDGQRPPEPESYEAAAAARRQATQREAAINRRLDAILARSAELDARKQVLVDRLLENGSRAPAATRGGN